MKNLILNLKLYLSLQKDNKEQAAKLIMKLPGFNDTIGSLIIRHDD